MAASRTQAHSGKAAVVLSVLLSSLAAFSADFRIVAAEQSSSSLVMVSGAPGATAEILWRWDSRMDPKILPAYHDVFRNIDECKPSGDGKEIFANASGGGVAAVDVATSSVKWYAFLPNGGAGPHSLAVLPDGKIAVANSTGVDALQIIDVSASPLDPSRQTVVLAMSLPGGHGAVWDARRGSLFALGYTNLYELAYSPADISVAVKHRWDYSKELGDPYGHDLVADGSGGYYLTNHAAVWHFDPDTERWTKVHNLANVKSFSRDTEKGDLMAIPKERWWTDELKVVEPSGAVRTIGPFPGARFYKARWMQADRSDPICRISPTAHAFYAESGKMFSGWTFVTPENGVVDDETTAPSGMDDLCYAFACAWDEDALYVCVVTIDDDISTDTCKKDATSCPAWDDDAVEVFIDGTCARLPDSRADGGVHLKHGGEFALVANGAANSDYSGYPNSFCRDKKAVCASLGSVTNVLWTGDVQQGPAVDGWRDKILSSPGCPVHFWPKGSKATKYTFVFPWRAMGRTNRPDRIGFNIGVQDDDGGGRRDHTLYWTGVPHRPYVNESAFGTLILMPAP